MKDAPRPMNISSLDAKLEYRSYFEFCELKGSCWDLLKSLVFDERGGFNSCLPLGEPFLFRERPCLELIVNILIYF